MTFFFFDQLSKDLKSDQSMLFLNVIIVSFSILALYAILFLVLYVLARRISYYQQRILMLISKVSQAENELIIQKSKVILNML
jgi:hypothetical protein